MTDARLESHTYRELVLDFAWLSHSENGVLSLANNTKARKAANDEIHISLYSSTIVKLSENKISVSLCGWNTPTTRRRIEEYLPDGFTIMDKEGVCLIVDSNSFPNSYDDRIKIASLSDHGYVDITIVWDEALGDYIYTLDRK